MTHLIVREASHWIGLLPLATVVLAWWKGKQPDPALWWLSVAFVVSWVADSLGHWFSPTAVTFSYVIGQSVLVAAVFLSRRETARLFWTFVCLAPLAVFLVPITGGHDYLLHLAAWVSAACIAQEQALGRLRTALVIYFGLGSAAYLWLAIAVSLPAMLAYQSTRLLGIVLFCAVVWRPDTVPTVYRMPKRVLA